jgi:hypothetical protein
MTKMINAFHFNSNALSYDNLTTTGFGPCVLATFNNRSKAKEKKILAKKEMKN